MVDIKAIEEMNKSGQMTPEEEYLAIKDMIEKMPEKIQGQIKEEVAPPGQVQIGYRDPERVFNGFATSDQIDGNWICSNAVPPDSAQIPNISSY